MTVDTQKLRELLEKATPGPWDTYVRRGALISIGAAHNCTVAAIYVPPVGDHAANAKLIAASRNALPALLDEIDRLRAQLNQTASMLQSACLVISDPEARAMALQQVRDARALLNPPAPPQGEKDE